MKKLLISMFVLAPMLALAGLNPVLQNVFTTNSASFFGITTNVAYVTNASNLFTIGAIYTNTYGTLIRVQMPITVGVTLANQQPYGLLVTWTNGSAQNTWITNSVFGINQQTGTNLPHSENYTLSGDIPPNWNYTFTNYLVSGGTVNQAGVSHQSLTVLAAGSSVSINTANASFATNAATATNWQGSRYTWYVRTNGNDGNSGSLSSPFLTLMKAVAIATNGQDISVGPGTYVLTTNIIIQPFGTRILGAGMDLTIFTGTADCFGTETYSHSGGPQFVSYGNSVLSDCTIKCDTNDLRITWNAYASHATHSGMWTAWGCSKNNVPGSICGTNCILLNVKTQNSYQDGVHFNNGTNMTVVAYGCEFDTDGGDCINGDSGGAAGSGSAAFVFVNCRFTAYTNELWVLMDPVNRGGGAILSTYDGKMFSFFGCVAQTFGFNHSVANQAIDTSRWFGCDVFATNTPTIPGGAFSGRWNGIDTNLVYGISAFGSFAGNGSGLTNVQAAVTYGINPGQQQQNTSGNTIEAQCTSSNLQLVASGIACNFALIASTSTPVPATAITASWGMSGGLGTNVIHASDWVSNGWYWAFTNLGGVATTTATNVLSRIHTH